MPLKFHEFKGEPKLEACLVSDPAHITPGAQGPHVAKIQKALIMLGAGTIDAGEIGAAKYGASTARTVKAYKASRKIINKAYQQSADDIVGKMTMAALDEEMAKYAPVPW
ncbi:MAG TPA: hypothetical protein VJ890_01140, partial [Vineibacter sp.]|nr:hypothetical protein [Vineibacter sp.]